ncbi:MAG: L-threonylcarbamoyladenylate synthase [Leptospiraceae bacterium]|nr:L-threonylcarbamoyladenylate synthase [Leptospiraceae bacterium]
MSASLINDPKQAGERLKKGEIIIFPTETVYGLGASSLNYDSCNRIYKIKNRPIDNPLIIHVTNVESILEFSYIDSKYLESINELTPGPISFIVQKKKEIFTAGVDTLAFRVPGSRLAREMLKYSGPVCAPSVNFSGRPSLTTLEDVKDEFLDLVDGILVGEEPEIGLESTVVDLSSEIPKYLRPGYLSFDTVKKYFPNIELHSEIHLSPGMKYRHYSPNAKVSWIKNDEEISEKDFAFIGFHSRVNAKEQCLVSNNREYALNLFHFFVKMDKKNISRIYCEMPLSGTLFDAIVNRIEKAINK